MVPSLTHSLSSSLKRGFYSWYELVDFIPFQPIVEWTQNERRQVTLEKWRPKLDENKLRTEIAAFFCLSHELWGKAGHMMDSKMLYPSFVFGAIYDVFFVACFLMVVPVFLLSRVTRPISHRVGRSIRRSVPLYFLGVFELFEGRIARVLLSYGCLCPCPNHFCPCPTHYCPRPLPNRPRQEQSCTWPCFHLHFFQFPLTCFRLNFFY